MSITVESILAKNLLENKTCKRCIFYQKYTNSEDMCGCYERYINKKKSLISKQNTCFFWREKSIEFFENKEIK